MVLGGFGLDLGVFKASVRVFGHFALFSSEFERVFGDFRPGPPM